MSIPPTRAELRKHLDEIGITGAAAEALCDDTALERHRSRVEATITAAVEYAGTVEGAVLVLLAELIGIGGRYGVEGAATARILNTLGKGRWHASDGRVYYAAAHEAYNSLLFDRIEQGTLLFIDHENLLLVSEIDCLKAAVKLPRLWLRSVARHLLRKLAGVETKCGHENLLNRFTPGSGLAEAYNILDTEETFFRDRMRLWLKSRHKTMDDTLTKEELFDHLTEIDDYNKETLWQLLGEGDSLTWARAVGKMDSFWLKIILGEDYRCSVYV